jgi:hypothetical protein
MGFAGNSNIGETPPPEFGDLVVLRGLDFADVIKLSETVPTTFRNLSHLEVLNVIKTGVKGPFPVGICVNGFSPEIVTEEGVFGLSLLCIDLYQAMQYQVVVTIKRNKTVLCFNAVLVFLADADWRIIYFDSDTS